MNTQLSIQDVSKELPMFDKKEANNMISKVDHTRIFVFVALTFGITVTAAFGIYLDGGTNSVFAPQTNLSGVLMLMIAFAPALGNIATRLITGEGWANTFLRPNFRHGWRFYLAAWILPLVAIFLGGAIYFLLFPDMFDLSMTLARETGKVSAGDTLATVLGSKFLGMLPQTLILTFVIWGEEFGWRAYLLPKLMPLGARKAVLLSGAVWGMFHWPMIFMGFAYGPDYWGAPITGPLLFVVIILAPTAVYSWMTLRTGSVWPACIAHAVNNAFPALTIYFLRAEPNALLGPGVEGIVGCLGYVLLSLPVFVSLRALAPAAGGTAAEQVEFGTSL